jgi:hypothetical protein
MKLVEHIPSHLIVVGHRTLISYEGKSTTYFGCNEIGHLYQVPAPKVKRGGGKESHQEDVGRSDNKGGCDPNGNDGAE